MAFGLLSRIRKRSPDDPPPTEAWPIHAFGKLPVYKDFVSAGLTEDGAREMRDWLSNGFSRLWSEREECKGAEIPLHGFLLHLPGSGRFVAGALWGSHDQGGLRKFPFLLFSVVPTGRGASNLLTALDYLPVFEKRAREIRRKYSSSGSLADVYAELRGARIELPMRPQDEVKARLGPSLSTRSVGTLARALLGEDAPRLWAGFLSAVDGAPLRVGEAGPGACRIPLAEELPPTAQLQLWVLRMIAASRRDMSPVGVLYRADAEAPAGVLFFRDLREEDFVLLHPEALRYNGVADLVAPQVRPEPPAEEVATPMAAESAAASPPPQPPPAPEPTPESAAEAAEPTPEPAGQAPEPQTSADATVSAPEVEVAGSGTARSPVAESPSPAPASEASQPAPPAAEEASGPEALREEVVELSPEPAPPPPPSPAPAVLAVLGSAGEADLREPASPTASPEPASEAEPEGWEKPVSSLLDGI